MLAIRNTTIAESELGRLVSFNLIRDKLGTSENEANTAIARAMQLYPGIKEVKLFGNFRYYYHESSMNGEALNAALEMAKNYIRISKGKANRIGHNWEACVEWFIDRFTVGAEFWTQSHRNNGREKGRMDSRRITLHLIKSVGDRRQNAEVDRVWTVTQLKILPCRQFSESGFVWMTFWGGPKYLVYERAPPARTTRTAATMNICFFNTVLLPPVSHRACSASLRWP